MRALLDRFGLDEDEVAQAVAEALTGLPSGGAAALTDDQVAMLSEAGVAGHTRSRGDIGHTGPLGAGGDRVAARPKGAGPGVAACPVRRAWT